MPKYRQLHIKILDSYDFAEMPDDFTRVVWLLFIVTMDSEGRGIDNPAWIRSRMFPLRPDISLEHIEASMDWLSGRGMITRYQVNGRGYFEIPTFKSYQSGTEKEAKSTLPPPPNLLQSNSRVTPEQVSVNTIQYNARAEYQSSSGEAQETSIAQASPSDPFTEMQAMFERNTGMLVPNTPDDIMAINEMIKAEIIEQDIVDAIAFFKGNGKLARGPNALLKSVMVAKGKRVQSSEQSSIIPVNPAKRASEVYG